MGKATRTCEHNTSYIESAQVMFPNPMAGVTKPRLEMLMTLSNIRSPNSPFRPDSRKCI